jgi:hypothetical protein
MGCLGPLLFVEREELLECKHPPKLLLVLEETSQMKSVARGFLKFEVGDGKNIHLWLDHWHPLGVLLD